MTSLVSQALGRHYAGGAEKNIPRKKTAGVRAARKGVQTIEMLYGQVPQRGKWLTEYESKEHPGCECPGSAYGH